MVLIFWITHLVGDSRFSCYLMDLPFKLVKWSTLTTFLRGISLDHVICEALKSLLMAGFLISKETERTILSSFPKSYLPFDWLSHQFEDSSLLPVWAHSVLLCVRSQLKKISFFLNQAGVWSLKPSQFIEPSYLRRPQIILCNSGRCGWVLWRGVRGRIHEMDITCSEVRILQVLDSWLMMAASLRYLFFETLDLIN